MQPDNTPFVHTFHCKLAGSYKALAVRCGFNTHPLVLYDGRLCYVTNQQRISRRLQGRSAYNSYSVRFLDGSCQEIPAGKFNRAVKTPPLPDEK